MKLSSTLSTFLFAVELVMIKQANAAAVPALFSAKLPEASSIPAEDHSALLPKRDAKNSADQEMSDYIVIFDKQTYKAKRDLHARWISEKIEKRSVNEDGVQSGIKGYFHDDENDHDEAIKGYYGTFSKRDADLIQESGDVALIEKDSEDTIQNDFVYIQYNTPWGLGRISHKAFDNNNGENDASYIFGSKGGANTTVYILDSGVRSGHTEFTGRVRWGANFVDNEEDDSQGHGTHISGIACGHNVGVSKFANIVVVKVIDSQRKAAVSNIVKGIQWIVNDHKSNPGQRSVINYSAVGSISSARAEAIKAATDAGIMVVTAAGNSRDDACKFGPADMSASNDGVITVAALNYTNSPASFSNFGSCVSVYAPGVSILSASDASDSSYMYMSGTSMSSPFVAGLVSYFWSLYPDSSVAEIKNMVVNYNDNQIQDIPGNSANKLAYNHL